MFDRIAASWALATSSWQVLRQEKRLVIFPILSGIGCMVVTASFMLPLLLARPWHQFVGANGQAAVPWWAYVVGFAFYFCNYFVVIFFNAALVSCALLRFNGQEVSINAGLQAAISRLPQIFAWALVSATVGMLLKVVESAHERAGQIISALLGTAWTIMTFFVVPVLVVEKLGPFQAVSRSIQILKKTWGEALIGRTGLSFFLFIGCLPAVAFLVLGIWLETINRGAGLGFFALFFAYLLGWSAIGSALNVIFQTALYQYAAFEEVPPGFDAEAMRSAFRAKRGRGR